MAPRESEMNDRPDAFAFVHQIKCLVDVFQRHGMRNEFVNLDAAIHILIDHARKLRTPFAATERRAAPDSSGHELEGPGAYFLSGAGDADDYGFSSAFVRAFQRGTHEIDVAHALE